MTRRAAWIRHQGIDIDEDEKGEDEEEDVDNYDSSGEKLACLHNTTGTYGYVGQVAFDSTGCCYYY